MTLDELKLDVVVLVCAISAGIHGALVPEHLEEGLGPGIAFAVATALAGAAAVVLTRRPSRPALLATGALLGGLIVAYVLAVTSGIPVVHPDQEAVDGLAVVTKAVEALGLIVASGLAAQGSHRHLLHPRGQIT